MIKDPTTAELAHWITQVRSDDIPEEVRHAARRAVYNWFGLVSQARGHSAVTIVSQWAAARPGTGATVIGGRSASPEYAALVHGVASHAEDFDDTHYATIIHPTAPVWSAVMAVAEQRGVSGAEALTAFIIGVDVACRVGLAFFPSHYNRGHHITSTAGIVGAAAAVGRLLKATPAQMEELIGLGSTLASGLKGTFGSMAKPLHPGKAAMEAIMAAELAVAGFTSGRTGLESPLGFAALADDSDLSRITDQLGQHWFVMDNMLKPFACGVVAHAAIDGILRHRSQALTAAEVDTVELRVHPRVRELTGNPKPATGLEGKFSVQHSVAVALMDGRAGPFQYTDARVADPAVVALRGRIRLDVDTAVQLDEAEVTVTTHAGERRRVWVEHVVSSQKNPFTDAMLDDKVADLLQDWPEAQIQALRSDIFNIDAQVNLSGLAGYLG